MENCALADINSCERANVLHMKDAEVSMGIQRVMVTGNEGYIGSVLTGVLAGRGYEVTGYDTCYYTRNEPLYKNEYTVARQIVQDVRDITQADFTGIDAVIHLAALSNDPLGALRPGITEQINFGGTMRVAEVAKASGVKRFIYASSQSMYGVADTSAEVDEDNSEKNPVTAYAITKWEAEQALRRLGDGNFTTVFFRPSTVFGASPRLRCDIVYNNLLASGYTTGAISILSDGTPWRPVVHVLDVCEVLLAGLSAPRDLVAGEAFNIGVPNGNYTVRDLALAAQKCLPDCKVAIVGERGSDERTYRVSFNKLYDRLSEYCAPFRSLQFGGEELVKMFDDVGFTSDDFTGVRCNRLMALQALLDEGLLDEDLRWTSGA